MLAEGGIAYVVTELLEGETLRAQLGDGALPVRKAVDYAAQMAQGLAAAHDKGITHRDLKPANVMITAEDKVKILDFGPAKALPADSAATGETDSPTITEAMTRAGTILGTAACMSPEQAKCRPVD